MKQNLRSIFLFFVFIFTSCFYACNDKIEKSTTQDGWDKNNTREIFPDNPDLIRSKELTKENLPYFISEFKKVEGNEYYAKFKLSEAGKYEHVWLRILSLNKKNSLGILDNEPTYFKEIKYADTLKFDIANAEDIMIFKNDSLILGGFLQKLSKQ